MSELGMARPVRGTEVTEEPLTWALFLLHHEASDEPSTSAKRWRLSTAKSMLDHIVVLARARLDKSASFTAVLSERRKM